MIIVKQLIDLIGDIVEISGNSTIDSILFAIIGATSFLIAFGFVGMPLHEKVFVTKEKANG